MTLFDRDIKFCEEFPPKQNKQNNNMTKKESQTTCQICKKPIDKTQEWVKVITKGIDILKEEYVVYHPECFDEMWMPYFESKGISQT